MCQTKKSEVKMTRTQQQPRVSSLMESFKIIRVKKENKQIYQQCNKHGGP